MPNQIPFQRPNVTAATISLFGAANANKLPSSIGSDKASDHNGIEKTRIRVRAYIPIDIEAREKRRRYSLISLIDINSRLETMRYHRYHPLCCTKATKKHGSDGLNCLTPIITSGGSYSVRRQL